MNVPLYLQVVTILSAVIAVVSGAGLLAKRVMDTETVGGPVYRWP